MVRTENNLEPQCVRFCYLGVIVDKKNESFESNITSGISTTGEKGRQVSGVLCNRCVSLKCRSFRNNTQA